MSTRMIQRKGTAAQWAEIDPVLNSGEIGFESDTNKFKIGDGVKVWTNLTYFTDADSIISAISGIVDGAPELLDTLSELAAALGNDPDYLTSFATIAYVDESVGNVTVDLPLAAGTGLQWNVESETFEVDSTIATQTALDTKLDISDPSIDYYITNSGSGGYLVNGVLNGPLNIEKGKKYRVIVNAVGHPFWIQTVSGGYSSGNLYSTGITNAGTDNGSILIELPQAAPDNLYYACQYHSSMAGSINSRSADLLSYATSSSATTYTVSSANTAKMTEFTAGTDITITVPSDPSDTIWPIGSGFELRQMGVGRLIISVSSPATIVSTDGYLKTRTQYSSVFLEKRAPNAWILTGDIDSL
jgi:hypothetical protein